MLMARSRIQFWLLAFLAHSGVRLFCSEFTYGYSRANTGLKSPRMQSNNSAYFHTGEYRLTKFKTLNGETGLKVAVSN